MSDVGQQFEDIMNRNDVLNKPCAQLHTMDDMMYGHHAKIMHDFYHVDRFPDGRSVHHKCNCTIPEDAPVAGTGWTLDRIVEQVNHNRDALHNEISYLDPSRENKPADLMSCPYCKKDLNWPRAVSNSGMWDGEMDDGERRY